MAGGKKVQHAYKPRKCKPKPWSVEGKVILITGANTGIGKATALQLASRKPAKIIITCRNVKQAYETVEEIQQTVEECVTEFRVIRLDLSSNEVVRQVADEILTTEKFLHVLINNAGMLANSERNLSVDGNELTFATNHLGHFLLTNLLLPLIKKSAPARIINVSSSWLLIWLYGNTFRIEDDPNFEQTTYSASGAYFQSKMANILFTKALHKRLEGTKVTCYTVHPGLIASDIIRNFNVIIQFLMPYFFPSTTSGAQTSVYCATEPGIEQQSSKYFYNCKEVNTGNFSESLIDNLWRASDKYTSRSQKSFTNSK